MAVIAVILHNVPQDRLMSDRNHRLWNILGILPDPGSKPAAEQYNLHREICPWWCDRPKRLKLLRIRFKFKTFQIATANPAFYSKEPP